MTAPARLNPSGASKSRRKGQVAILSMHGSQDGLRFGMVLIGGRPQRYLHDRLAGVVRLYKPESPDGMFSEDADPMRRAAAQVVLDAAWAMERGGV